MSDIKRYGFQIEAISEFMGASIKVIEWSGDGQPFVLAADYDARIAEFESELRLRREDHYRMDARVAELEGLLREAVIVCRTNGLVITANYFANALAGQPQHGTPEWPKEQCPVTGAIRDVDPADLGDQQQGEQCSTCRGTGEIDQRLGGEWNSPVVPCPDCDGEGEPDDNWIMSPCSQGHTDVGAAGGIAHCYICGESVTGETTEEAWRKWEITHAHFKAEQPATAAVAEVIWPPSDIRHGAFKMLYPSSELMAGVKLYTAAALAPAVAVVMPERMTTIPEGKTISYAAGYEAALDAVANLNRNTVPLELLGRISRWPCADHINAIDELRAILGAKP